MTEEMRKMIRLVNKSLKEIDNDTKIKNKDFIRLLYISKDLLSEYIMNNFKSNNRQREYELIRVHELFNKIENMLELGE